MKIESSDDTFLRIVYFLKVITAKMKCFMQQVKEKAIIAVVGGSDLDKIKEQMGGESCECVVSFCNDSILAF